MHAEAHACIAFSLASGAQNSLEDASLHSTLLHHASASRILSDHVDPELSFPALDAVTTLDLPEETTLEMYDEQVDEAIEELGEEVERVLSHARVAFSIVELHLSMTLPLPRVLP